MAHDVDIVFFQQADAGLQDDVGIVNIGIDAAADNLYLLEYPVPRRQDAKAIGREMRYQRAWEILAQNGGDMLEAMVAGSQTMQGIVEAEVREVEISRAVFRQTALRAFPPGHLQGSLEEQAHPQQPHQRVILGAAALQFTADDLQQPGLGPIFQGNDTGRTFGPTEVVIPRAEAEDHEFRTVWFRHMGDGIIVLAIDHALEPPSCKSVKFRFIHTVINLQHPFIDE